MLVRWSTPTGGAADYPVESDVRLNVVYANGTMTGTYTTDADTIAAAVWDSLLADHSVPGSYGKFVKKLLTTIKFLGLS